MNPGELLNTALAVVSIATLGGLGWLRGTVTNLREQLRDERDSATSLRTERADDRAEIAELKADLAAMTRVITGEVHLVAIREELGQHHREATVTWGEIRNILERIHVDLQEPK